MDVPAYPEWFPPSLSFEIERHVPDGPGSRFGMKTQPVSWKVEVLEVEPLQRIHMRYYDGPWTGTATWRLEANGDRTELYYDVNLKTQGMMMTMLSKMMDLNEFNSNQMQKVFAGLQQYLGRQ
jgi:uncharacterized protein YndB with AHSA1/START domain